MIIFAHIEKCGGTSIHNFLKSRIDNYCVLKPFPSHGELFRRNQLDVFRKIFPKIQGYGGHRLRLFEEYGNDINYITVVRSPLDRYLSHMRHHLERGIITSPEKFTTDEYFDNFICKRISGKPSFYEAKKIILEKNVAVFVLERQMNLIRANLSHKTYNIDGAIGEGELFRKNCEDILLYNWALDRYEQKIEDYLNGEAVNRLGKVELKFMQNVVQPLVHLKVNFGSHSDKLSRGY